MSRRTNDHNDAREELQSFTDERTRSKIHRHLTDINDLISDDDIRQVRSDFSAATVAIEISGNTRPKETANSVVDNEKAKEGREEIPSTYILTS